MVLGQDDVVAVTLSGQDILMLQLLARGYTRAQIAGLVECDERAIQGLMAHVTQYLGQQDWRQAVAIALQRGLII